MNKTDIPDFLIVGAGKSGTTSLHHYLTEHPDVCMPIKLKELNFWHTFNHEEERAILKKWEGFPLSIDEYEEHFIHRNEQQLCGEISPSYLYFFKDTVSNLKALKKDWQKTKIIIILREPIDKIWSHYRFSKNKKLDPENLSLEEAINKEEERKKDFSLLPDLFFISNTMYYEQVKFYKENFTYVKLLLYDDLKNNKYGVLREIEDFLGIKRHKYSNSSTIYNSSNRVGSIKPKYQKFVGRGIGKLLPRTIKLRIHDFIFEEEKMNKKTRQLLVKTFKIEIEKLNKIIDKDLSIWLKLYE